jgi:putative IMPACT (imprinted ancient) family translation regulator
MAQLDTLTAAAATWEAMTNGDATSITFQNQAGINMLVKGTTDDTAPTTTAGAIIYPPFMGERNVTITDLFPEPSGVDRLWFRFEAGPGSVMVSHA